MLFDYVHAIKRPGGRQPFPAGLVVRIWHSHRHGPGSITGQGKSFCPLMVDREIKLCFVFEKPGPQKNGGRMKNSFLQAGIEPAT